MKKSASSGRRVWNPGFGQSIGRNALRKGGVGSFWQQRDHRNAGDAQQIQHIVVEQKPARHSADIWGTTSIHGFRTIFPIPLGLSCAWEPGLLKSRRRWPAREASAAGIDWRSRRWWNLRATALGPHPWRFWRGPCSARSTRQLVADFQNPAKRDRRHQTTVVACLKLCRLRAAEGWRDYNTRKYPVHACAIFICRLQGPAWDAGAWTVNERVQLFEGNPASANYPHAYGNIRTSEVSRSSSATRMRSRMFDHGVAADEAAAGGLLTAGVDMEMVSTTYPDTLKQQVEQGTVSKKYWTNPSAGADGEMRRACLIPLHRRDALPNSVFAG